MARKHAEFVAVIVLALVAVGFVGCGIDDEADLSAITPPASAQRNFTQSELGTSGQVGITPRVLASRVVFESDVAAIDDLVATDFDLLQMTSEGLNFVDPSDAAFKVMMDSLRANGNEAIGVRIVLDDEMLGEAWVYYPGDRSTGATGIRYSGSDAPRIYSRLTARD